ncbi:hypothetical protein CYY_001163 [Polysphondylium violaceum]|uniref:Rab GTPase domain-containing protein n=1 Tax=Polysphondylium violaceum TaxID=133409 RepID=A0A8J4Q2I2_9MYCE|nr:hypothetical protein CYY_001163 [Polysphondylium violaceum]
MWSFLSRIKNTLFGDTDTGSGSAGGGDEGDPSIPLFDASRGYITSTFRSDPYQSVDKVRVIVVGDTAVGKSSLVHLLCHGEVQAGSPSWTLGCNTDVKIHEYHSKDYFVEFVDVGGASKYKIARPILYHQVNGIIVVYDLTNKNSLANVKKWIFDILSKVSVSSTNWVLKETENPQILELENTNESSSLSPVTSPTPNSSVPLIQPFSFSLNNNNNNSNSSSSSSTSNTITHRQTAQSSPNNRPVFLSQTSHFLPTNTSSKTLPTTNKSKSKSTPSSSSSTTTQQTTTTTTTAKEKTNNNNSNKLPNIPVLILGNKSDLLYDSKFIENDKLGKISLIVSAKDKKSFTQSSYNANRVDLFFNKMISNLMSGKKRNLTSMTFNSQIFHSSNAPSPPPRVASSTSLTSNLNHNNNNINDENHL